ncbi:hypothetical protein [Streptomyces milbemycinicus]|uniref:hypothetical protein n=1 Tax=Streptomyces milbemycinicus TaxID=476552 RepID=UPI0033C4E315
MIAEPPSTTESGVAVIGAGTPPRQAVLLIVLVTHNVRHAMMVGDHFAVLIRGQKADDFRKGERTREEITDLMAGGEAMAHLEAELAQLQADA